MQMPPAARPTFSCWAVLQLSFCWTVTSCEEHVVKGWASSPPLPMLRLPSLHTSKKAQICVHDTGVYTYKYTYNIVQYEKLLFDAFEIWACWFRRCFMREHRVGYEQSHAFTF